ncbi:hypothetical protein EI555_009591, partial [Monodon monoceros]
RRRTRLRDMWVRTTLRIERWTKEKTEDDASWWDESSTGRGERLSSPDWEDSVQMSITYINRLPSWERGHLLAGVASSTDASTFSSEGEFQDTDGCCWKHRKRTGRVIHPFTSDYGHHAVHLHSISHCDCESRLKDCSEKTYSSSGDVGLTCSQDVDSACFNIIQCPCFELIPEGECVERFWCGWPLSVAVIHHPIHRMGMVTGTPDLAAPITIWRSERPTGKSQGNKMIKKIKKKKGKEKDKEEETDEKAKVKKKVKKGKLTKKKSPVKSESPPDLNRSLSPRELARMSESSPDSWRDLESEDSYNDPGREEPSSEDIVESLSPRKREKNGVQAKKPRMKTSPVKKVNKRKSPPASNPNLS